MDEVDPGVGCAAPGLLVEHPDALFAQPVGQGLEVADAVSQLLDAGPALSRNFAITGDSSIGAISWTCALPIAAPRTDNIASRIP